MNIVTDSFFHYDFMQHAFFAGTLAALLASLVGYFLLLRNLAFAGHGLSHIGFTGATAAMLFGINAMSGQLIFTLLAAAAMGILGDRVQKSDTAIAIILALALGLGSLFLHFYVGSANAATGILFGDLLGVSLSQLYIMLALSLICLIVLALMARPLLFASLEPEIAQAKGVSLPGIAIVFLLIVAVAVTLASQVVGILLVFTLLVGPPAIALKLTKRVASGLTVSVAIALGLVWVALVVSYYTNWPISFLISFLVFVIYISVGAIKRD